MFGKKATFHRFQNTYGVSYKFAGQESVGQPMAGAPAAVRAFDEVLRTTEALREYNSILLNYYDADPKDGGPRHYMGPHSDDEKSLMPLTPIISLSWCTAGHARKFRFIPKPTCADALVPPGWAVPGVDGPVVTLRNGDLVVMGGTCQRTHKHEVMQVLKRSPLEEQSGRRINLTFRWFGAAEERKRKREGRAVDGAARRECESLQLCGEGRGEGARRAVGSRAQGVVGAAGRRARPVCEVAAVACVRVWARRNRAVEPGPPPPFAAFSNAGGHAIFGRRLAGTKRPKIFRAMLAKKMWRPAIVPKVTRNVA